MTNNNNEDSSVNLMGENFHTRLSVEVSNLNPDVEIIRDLLAKGADPNIKCGSDSRTALSMALSTPNPDVEIIKLLLEKRANVKTADINIEDINHETPFVLMVKNRELWHDKQFKEKILGYIQEERLDTSYRYRCREDATKDAPNKNVEGENYFHIAAKARNKDAFTFMMESFCGVSTMLGQMNSGINGNTPLHEAAISGMLLDVIKSIVSTIEDQIHDLKDTNGTKSVTNAQEINQKISKLTCTLKKNKEIIRGKLKIINKDGNSPIACLGSKESQKELKDYMEIRDPWLPKFVRSRALVTTTAILAAAAFGAALYILYIHAPALALSVMASQAGSCSTFMLYKVYSMSNQDITSHTLLDNLDVDSPAYDNLSLGGISI